MRSIKVLVGGLLLLGSVFTLILVSRPNAYGQSGSSDESLVGVYGFASQGLDPFQYTNGSLVDFQPFTVVGRVTFYKDGTISEDDVINLDGTSFPRHVTGTFAMSGEGVGSMTFLDGSKHRDFVVVSHGKQIKYVQSDPDTGIVSGGVMDRQ
jgi:hypothetical protein